MEEIIKFNIKVSVNGTDEGAIVEEMPTDREAQWLQVLANLNHKHKLYDQKDRNIVFKLNPQRLKECKVDLANYYVEKEKVYWALGDTLTIELE